MHSKTTAVKILIICLVGLAIILAKMTIGSFLTLEFLKAKHTLLKDFYIQHQILSMLAYFFSYILVATLALPGAAILTLLGGAIFGFLTSTILTSFASTIGATLSFLLARYILRDYVQSRFKEKLKTINAGIKKDGPFYLFALRLIPAIPFFVVNLLMGLTPLKTRTFIWISQLGMLPATMAYTNAGTRLAHIESLSGILTPGVLISFAILGILPFLSRFAKCLN